MLVLVRPGTTPVHRLTAGLVMLAFGAACDDGPAVPGQPGTPPLLHLEEAYPFPPLPPGDYIRLMEFDSEGGMWLASARGSVFRLAGSETESFDATGFLGDGIPWDLFIDSRDRVWIAGGEGRIASYADGEWRDETPPDPMGFAPVASQVAVNDAGDVLFARGHTEAGGLLLRRGGSWTRLSEADGLPTPIFLDLEPAPDGSFWAASSQWQGRGGVTRIANGGVEDVVDVENGGLLYNWVDDLEVGGGKLWMGFAVPIYLNPDVAHGGLQSLPLEGGSSASWFPVETGLTSNRVLSVSYSTTGEVWFTTGPGECEACAPAVGLIHPFGALQVLSAPHTEHLPQNAWLPAIDQAPDGTVYVLHSDGERVLRVVR